MMSYCKYIFQRSEIGKGKTLASQKDDWKQNFISHFLAIFQNRFAICKVWGDNSNPECLLGRHQFSKKQFLPSATIEKHHSNFEVKHKS